MELDIRNKKTIIFGTEEGPVEIIVPPGDMVTIQELPTGGSLSVGVREDVDRSRWRSGPWDSEPDRVEWPSHGLLCLILRNDLGSLCGYVGIPRDHPMYNVHYDEVKTASGGTPSVHGGLTYGGDVERLGGYRQCHAKETWWLGFDCAHCGDDTPALSSFSEREYRSVEYVRSQVESLALQMGNLH